MTMLLAINFGEYGIMASDKAAMDCDGIMVSNKEDKIIKTQIGYITGTGFVPLLDNVKNKLKEKEISNTNEIVDLIKKERDFIENHINYINHINYKLQDLSIYLKNTGFLFSYNTKKGLKIGFQYPNWMILNGCSEEGSF